jgi:hypothetical protein
MNVHDWLLDGDPAIRWQVLRDLDDAPADVVEAERARTASEGWGARLLALRDPDGQWAGGACFPAGPHDPSAPQPWTSTLPTLDLLCAFGLDPDSDAAREMVALVAQNCRWEYDGSRYFDGEVEPCINGRTVLQGAYFGVDVSSIVNRLVGETLDDGGWNCEAENGSVRSSFHSTIDVLEGLREYEARVGASPEVQAARRRGEEYLLERGLMRRRSTGEIAADAFTRFAFPPRWHYDVLRGLDYLRAVGDRPDPRTAEAVQLVRDKQQPDGTWLLENTYPGQVHFRLEDGDGHPSRWNTLRALRVLRWADTR